MKFGYCGKQPARAVREHVGWCMMVRLLLWLQNIFSELGFKVAYCNVIGGGRYEVRFEDAVDTVPMLKAFNDSGCKIGDEVAKAEMITGDEEKAIWERILAGGKHCYCACGVPGG